MNFIRLAQFTINSDRVLYFVQQDKKVIVMFDVINPASGQNYITIENTPQVQAQLNTLPAPRRLLMDTTTGGQICDANNAAT